MLSTGDLDANWNCFWIRNVHWIMCIRIPFSGSKPQFLRDFVSVPNNSNCYFLHVKMQTTRVLRQKTLNWIEKSKLGFTFYPKQLTRLKNANRIPRDHKSVQHLNNHKNSHLLSKFKTWYLYQHVCSVNKNSNSELTALGICRGFVYHFQMVVIEPGSKQINVLWMLLCGQLLLFQTVKWEIFKAIMYLLRCISFLKLQAKSKKPLSTLKMPG